MHGLAVENWPGELFDERPGPLKTNKEQITLGPSRNCRAADWTPYVGRLGSL